MISLVQLSIGFFVPTKLLNIAVNSVKRRAAAQTMIFSATVACSTIIEHTSANAIGMPVSITCTAALALSTVFASTGSDCGIHMLLPSSDTDGAAISFIVETSISIAHSSRAT